MSLLLKLMKAMGIFRTANKQFADTYLFYSVNTISSLFKNGIVDCLNFKLDVRKAVNNIALFALLFSICQYISKEKMIIFCASRRMVK